MTLSRRLRKALSEQNWLTAIKYRRNKYELKRDIAGYMKRDLDDLGILAAKAPEDMLEDVYTPEKISVFVAALLQEEQTQNRIKELVDKVNNLRKPIIDIQTKLDADRKMNKLSASDRLQLETELKRLEMEGSWRQVDEELDQLIRSVDVRRTRIARLLINHAMRYLIDQYMKVEREIPILNKVTNSMLEAQELAGSIVNKIVAAQVESNNDKKILK
jgi:hypothetical protein